MHWQKNGAMVCALLLSSGVGPASAQSGNQPAATVRHVAVLGGNNHLEIEIASSERVAPQTQVITGPDRIVIDFPNAVPGSGLRNFSVNRGEVKSVRVGLFSANPPVTRVVLDMNGPPVYQVFPSGKTVIVKLGSSGGQGTGMKSAVISSDPTVVPPPLVPAPAPRVQVGFVKGNLTIHADKATLAEVLTEVHRSTGADVPIPPGTDQERVVAELGPAPAREVLAALLNGSRFNFVLVGSDHDPARLQRVLLTVKGSNVTDVTPAPMYSPPSRSEPSSVENYAPPAEIAPAPDIPAEQPLPQEPPPENPPQQ